METQAELVAAAEALRTWVHTQRTAWSESDVPRPARDFTPMSLVGHAPAGIAPANAPVPAVHAPETPVQRPVPTPPAARPSAPQPIVLSDLPAAVEIGADPRPAASTPVHAVTRDAPSLPAIEPSETTRREVDDDTSVPVYNRLWARIAAGVVLVAVAGGAFVWGRSDRGPTVGTAAFDSAPAGAQVFVDGKPVGSTPVKLELNTGGHSVEFKLKQATRTQTIDVKKGEELAVNVDWNPRRVGTLQVSSTPTGSKVSIDGRLRGQTPVTLSDLPVGPHTVHIESSDGSVRRKVDIAEGRTESLAESIYPGWLHVSAPVEVSIVDGTKGMLLDDSNRLLLKPGDHTIRIENRLLEFSETRQVTIEPGGTTKVAVDLPMSTLTVTGSSGAEVLIDGTNAGETPLTDFQVKPGGHDIMVIDTSGVTRHASVTVTTKPTQIDIPLGRP